MPRCNPKSNVLQIKKICFFPGTNGKEHHTDQFDLMKRKDFRMVLRRGQAFTLKFHFNRPYNSSRDKLTFMFRVADVQKPSLSHGTLIAVPLKNLTDKANERQWNAFIEHQSGSVMRILMYLPPDALVTRWKLNIIRKLIKSGASKTLQIKKSFYVLFNPWSPLDEVFLEDESARNEYVLNDATAIWVGNYMNFSMTPWKLGQYERDILDCAIYLMNKIGKISPSQRSSAVRVSRALSAAVNSNDDAGVLVGKWGDNVYAGGVEPTKWSGSVKILQQYYQQKKPVKFGQCFVFAGCLGTILRCIGIPARIVTNFQSAHDTNANLSIDRVLDTNDNVLADERKNGIWNFHVWNEVWMQRADLNNNDGHTYDGWQVIDATPQELSNKMFRCGPASVEAIKRGDVLKSHDTAFIYAEVNADVITWRHNTKKNESKIIKIDTTEVGRLISTKAIGKWKREDITHSYKHEEETDEERAVMKKALKKVNNDIALLYLQDEYPDIEFKFVHSDDVMVGKNVLVEIQVKNKSADEEHTVRGTLRVESAMYNGYNNEEIESLKFSEAIEPDSEIRIALEVSFEEYSQKLANHLTLSVSCIATVLNTDYDFFDTKPIILKEPELDFHFQDDDNRGTEFMVSFTNPLPISLTNGYFQIEGTGIDEPIIINVPDAEPEEIVEGIFSFAPSEVGTSALFAKFNSDQLCDLIEVLEFEADSEMINEISDEEVQDEEGSDFELGEEEEDDDGEEEEEEEDDEE